MPPMKFVATPRPEKNDWKSIVGPWIEALAPPAHSTWATFLPPRSADWAIDSACRTPGANAEVEPVKGRPLMWNVLFVEPVTAGQAPVASEYQPAPVLGGAWVSSPPPSAEMPLRRKSRIVGITPEYFSTRSWRMPSEAKNTAFGSPWPRPFADALGAGPATETATRPPSRPSAESMAIPRRRTVDLIPEPPR